MFLEDLKEKDITEEELDILDEGYHCEVLPKETEEELEEKYGKLRSDKWNKIPKFGKNSFD